MVVSRVVRTATSTVGDVLAYLPLIANSYHSTSATPSVEVTVTPTLAITPSSTSTTTPSVIGTPTVTPRPQRTAETPPLFGVQVFGEIADTSQWDAVHSYIQAAGARWVRVYLEWSSVEPSAPQDGVHTYRWDNYDTIFRRTAEAGLTPLVVFSRNPAWAAEQYTDDNPRRICGPMDPENVADFAAFVAAAVERYDGDDVYDGTPPPDTAIKSWEIFNEPDFDYTDNPRGESDYGSCWGDNPAAYAEMMRAVYRAVKDPLTGADSQSYVFFGSVAYERFNPSSRPSWYNGSQGPFNYSFIDGVLDYLDDNYGADPLFPFFDVMNFHNYNDFRNEWDGGGGPASARDAKPYNQEILGKIKHIRDNKLYKPGHYDLRHIPFASSEVGVTSGPTDQWTERSETLQSMYPAQVYARSKAAGLLTSIWFTIVDHDWLYWEYGLLRNDLTPKLVYTAYQVAADQLAGALYDRQLSPDETGSADIEAYRFVKLNGSALVICWTDTGERFGRIGTPSIQRDMTFTPDSLGGQWSGQLRVTDRMGTTQLVGTTGVSAVTIALNQSPIYVEVGP